LREGALFWGTPTAPLAELVHEGNLKFSVKGTPISVEFRRNDAGEVVECITYQADGKPIGVRYSADVPTPQALSALIGEYSAGTLTVVIGRSASGNLTFASKGYPGVELLHARREAFVTKGFVSQYIEFARAPDGTVMGLAIRTADSSSFLTRTSK
jgi:hypothetical protein